MRLLLALCVAALGGSATAEPLASDRGLDGFVTVDRLPVPEHPVLAAGRLVWADNCQNCHGGDKFTGAPKITSTRAWSPRIEQGFDVLIDHAVNGFIGPKYTQMPARGGNPDLSDDQVASAIAFMVWASGSKDAAIAHADHYLSEGKSK